MASNQKIASSSTTRAVAQGSLAGLAAAHPGPQSLRRPGAYHRSQGRTRGTFALISGAVRVTIRSTAGSFASACSMRVPLVGLQHLPFPAQTRRDQGGRRRRGRRAHRPKLHGHVLNFKLAAEDGGPTKASS